MKKTIFSMIALAMAAITFTSCEDVPAPYDYPGTGGNQGGGDTPEGVYLDQSFAKELGEFKSIGNNANITWTIDYSSACITGFKDYNGDGTKTNEAGVTYLVSPEVDLTNATKAHIEMNHAMRYERADVNTNNAILISKDYNGDPTTAKWVAIPYSTDGINGAQFDFVDVAANIPDEFIGSKIRLALRHTCTESYSSTWEVKSLSIKDGEAENTGGNETPDTPVEGEYINETFATSFGSFTEKTIKGNPWIIDFSCAKATGYDNASKTTTPSESYIVSKAIDLSASKGAVINFDYILRYFTNYGAAKPGVADKVLITDNYTNDVTTTKWTDITGTLTEGMDWNTWSKFSANIPAEFLGKKAVVIALYYACEDNSATWEVKNFIVKDGKAAEEGGNEGGDVAPAGDGMTISSIEQGRQGSVELTSNSYGNQNVTTESTWLTWNYDNIIFKGAKVCAATGDFSGCIQIQGNASDTSKQGFLFNETAFGKDIKSIVITVKGLAKYETPTTFSVYGGTEAHPVTNTIEAKTTTEKGETLNTFTMTYDFSAGSYKHFTIWNNAVGALYIEKLAITLK